MYKPAHKLFKVASIELVAICNVACIVCFFFLFTSKFRANEAAVKPLICDLPIPYFYMPSDTITLTKSGIVFNLHDKGICDQVLSNMSDLYRISFTDQEKSTFKNSGLVRVRMNELKSYLDNSDQHLTDLTKLKISANSDCKELSDWIYQLRLVARSSLGTDARITVKIDKNVPANNWQQVGAILKKQKINSFRLITDTGIITIKSNQLH